MPASVEAVVRFVRGYLRFEERVQPADWCTRIYLPPGENESSPGYVNFRERPYLREPINDRADPSVRESIFVGPTRIGKTFILRMQFVLGVGWDPAPTIWVDPTIDKARSISLKELQPVVAANSSLRDRRPRDKNRMTNTMMLFPGSPFSMYGANSPAQVSGDSARVILGNECDKWLGSTEAEASIIDLVRHRSKDYNAERKHFFSSTPTLETGTIWTEYLKGDQRLYHVRCPDCGRCQALVWKQVWWPPEAQIDEHRWDLDVVQKQARYVCVHCRSHWDDAMRLLAIQHRDGCWVPQAKAQPGYRSRAINGLYGPNDTNNIGVLAVKFLAARTTGFFKDRQDFWNSDYGEPWRDDMSEVTAQKFSALQRPYMRGTLPDSWRPDVTILEYDVQTNGFWWVLRAFQWSGEAHLVDHGKCGSWLDLERIQDDYLRLGGQSYVIGDINFEERRAECLEQIWRRQDRGWIGAEGFEHSNELVRLEAANVFMGGKLQKEKVTAPKLVISLYEFKVELEKRLTGEIHGWHNYQLPIFPDDRLRRELDEYHKQMLDEKRRPRKHRVAGKPPFEFHSTSGNNHYFDCEVYGLALFWALSKNRSYAARSAGGPRRVIKTA